jgi:3-deoxy-D-manno-octulosonic-acid transferase
MDILDASCLAAACLAGALGRGLERGLPAAVAARLGAEAPRGVAPGWVWLHAVSVGELLLAAGVVGRLRERGCRVHVTTGTPAGLGLLASRAPVWDAGTGRVTGGCFPFDDPRGLSGFLETPPGAFIALETEIWPNLFRELEASGAPICIVNGRLTEKTAKSAFDPFLRRAASRLSAVAARDAGSAALFRAMGAPNVALCGNLKADLPPPAEPDDGWGALLAAWGGAPVLVAGNTVEGEEELVFAAWEGARERFPGARLIVAPRQPRRFGQVAAWLASRGCAARPRSWGGGAEEWRGADVMLLDTMGELASAYRLGHAAMVGGGWRARGGHNPLEPLRWGVPTLIGPGFSNFADIVGPLLESAAPLRVVGEGGLAGAAAALLAERDPGRGWGSGWGSGARRVELPPQLKDTLQKTWECLLPHLPG